MPQVTVNPYPQIGVQISDGLTSIIGALSGSPSIDDLINAVYGYVQPLYFPAAMYPGSTVPAQLVIELKSIAATAINSYVNNLVMGGKAGYNGNQFPFIMKLIGSQLTANLPITSIGDRIANVEDLISESGLTVSEQTPFLLATTIGNYAYIYWSGDVASGTPAWAAFYPPAPENYMDLPYYIEAAMVGALAGYGATPSGMMEPSVNFVTNQMLSALIGALTVTAGKVIFEWQPRIQPMSVAAMGALGGIIGNRGSLTGPVGPGGHQPPPGLMFQSKTVDTNGQGGTAIIGWYVTGADQSDQYYLHGGNAYWVNDLA